MRVSARSSVRSPFRHLEICGNGTTIRYRREEATGTQHIHPIARFPSIIVIGGQSIILTTLSCPAKYRRLQGCSDERVARGSWPRPGNARDRCPLLFQGLG